MNAPNSRLLGVMAERGSLDSLVITVDATMLRFFAIGSATAVPFLRRQRPCLLVWWSLSASWIHMLPQSCTGNSLGSFRKRTGQISHNMAAFLVQAVPESTPDACS